MHSALIKRFPRLGLLWARSNKTKPNNYFGIYTSATLNPSAEQQFVEWEALLQCLDPQSLEVFLRKAAGRVTANSIPSRGWSQLVDSVNEVRAYRHIQSLGYTTARLLDEQATPLPDIEASNSNGQCLAEAKTLQNSDEDLALFGQVQSGEDGLPIRLQRLIRKRYSQASEQMAGHPLASTARKICYMRISPDLRTLLVGANSAMLEEFIKDLEGDVEIHCVSQYWPANLNVA